MGENDPEEELRLILIGNTGSGKSASGNTILGRQHFLSEISAGSVIKVCQLGTSDYPVDEAGRWRSQRKKVVVLDMPGFGDTHLTQEQIITEISRCVALTAPGPHAFLLVVPLGRYTEDEDKALNFMTELFGKAAVRNHTVVLFTRGDDLDKPVQQFLARAPDKLKALLDKCGGRYHVFNNKAHSDVQQVHKLLLKVEKVVEDNGGGCYTNAMLAAFREEEDRVRREDEDRLRKEEEDRVKREDEDWVRKKDRVNQKKENDPEEELRLILIGNTGSGKSASGNTILGRQHFLSEISAGSVIKVCQLGTSDYPVGEAGRWRSQRKKVVVLDMPGFGDTHLTQEQIITEISRCVALTAPGPHAFLLVVPLGRYTEDEDKAINFMTEVFGKAAVRNHTVLLFTRGDDLDKPVQQFLARAPDKLKALLDMCRGRYHVFNNKAHSDVQQVHKLLLKVEKVVEDNGGGCYTNAMLAAFREEEDRVRREEEDMVKREEEDMVKREEEDRVRREDEDRVRKEDRLNQKKENDPEEELRLILIGNTGSGKSASGNTILGRQHFLSEISAGSVIKVCQLGTSDYPVGEAGRRRSQRKKVVVLDMPGFGDTHLTQEQIITEISRCVSLTAPGPHAFLLVVPLGRYTEDEDKALNFMTEVFGEDAVRNHTVVLFTRGDDLDKPVQQFLARAPDKLKALLDKCRGRYHVFNNKAHSDVQQVHKLLLKVEKVVEDNGGGCYTNAMLAAFREEEDRVRREDEDRLRKEEEDRVKREDEDRVRREDEDRVRREDEDRVRKEEEERVRKEEEDRVKREDKDWVRKEDRVRREEEDMSKREDDNVRRDKECRDSWEEAVRVSREEDRVRREEEDRVRKEEWERIKEDQRRKDEDRAKREEDRVKKEEDRARKEREERSKREDEDRVRRDKEDRDRREEKDTIRREEEERVRKEENERRYMEERAWRDEDLKRWQAEMIKRDNQSSGCTLL